MASLVKRGKSYRIKFIHPITKIHSSVTVSFIDSPAETLHLAKTKKADIEKRIALHKANLKRFTIGNECDNMAEMTLGEFLNIIGHDDLRQTEVDSETFKADMHALNNLVNVLGPNLGLRDLAGDPRYINQFKQARFKLRISRCKEKKQPVDEDKIKRGININLKDLSAVFNHAVRVGHIPEHFVPKLQKYKTTRKIYAILDEHEIIGTLQALDKSGGKGDATLDKGDAWLAYVIIRETGARRSAIARKSLNLQNGLKWRHINWMRNTITLISKGKQYTIPMTKLLRKTLTKRKTELAQQMQPEALVIQYTTHTLSHYFKRAMKKAGVDKPGAVHILRHTLPVELLEAGANIVEVRDWLNHADLSTTNIYSHIVNERLQRVAKLRDKAV